MNRTASALVALVLASTLGCEAPQDGVGDLRYGPLGERSEADTSTCGQSMASFDGVAAKSNGSCACSKTGCSCGGQGEYGLDYQCVELVMRYFKIKFGLSWYGNAADLLKNAPLDKVDVYYNGDAAHPPVRGDMIVWTDTTLGHVALVTDVVPGSHVTIIQQNVCGVDGSPVQMKYDGKTVYGPWTWKPPHGWAHAKANGGTVAPPPVCPCYDGDQTSFYCGSGLASYAKANGCSLPSVYKGNEGDLFTCKGGTWSVGTACPGGCHVNQGDNVADSCNSAPTGSGGSGGAGTAGAGGDGGTSPGGHAGTGGSSAGHGGSLGGAGGKAGASGHAGTGGVVASGGSAGSTSSAGEGGSAGSADEPTNVVVEGASDDGSQSGGCTIARTADERAPRAFALVAAAAALAFARRRRARDGGNER